MSTLSLYAATLMAVAAWSAALILWPIVRTLRAKNCLDWPSNLWFLLGIAPFLVGLAAGCSSFFSALLKGLSVIPDHCELHPHHPHFCWFHMDTLLPGGVLFWLVLVSGMALLLFSSLKVGHSIMKFKRALRSVERPKCWDGFLIVPSHIPAAFVAGIFRPRPYLTSSAVRLLNGRERRIVAAHEQEHVRRRDPLKLLLLKIAGSLFPGFRLIEGRWKAAAEVECDSASLQTGARPEEIALIIVKLARAVGSKTNAPALAYAFGSGSDLSQRVECLLSGVQPWEQRVACFPLVSLLLILISMGLSRTHHALETVLGYLLR